MSGPLNNSDPHKNDFFHPEASMYALQVWSETLIRQTIITFANQGWDIHEQVTEMRRAGKLDDRFMHEYEEWRDRLTQKIQLCIARQKDIISVGDTAQISYQYQEIRRRNNKLIMERPQFHIDATKPLHLLQVQKTFDVAREARHLSSSHYTSAQIQQFRAKPGRIYYDGSVHITVDVSREMELMVLQQLGNEQLQSTFLPAGMAGVLERCGNGLRVRGREPWLWNGFQRYGGGLDEKVWAVRERGKVGYWWGPERRWEEVVVKTTHPALDGGFFVVIDVLPGGEIPEDRDGLMEMEGLGAVWEKRDDGIELPWPFETTIVNPNL